MSVGAVALVQGASRGLGLQFCQHLLVARPELHLVATCRHPRNAPHLLQLKQQHKDRLHILQMDITLEPQIEATAESVKESHGKLDLLINCAAMLHPSGKGETSLQGVSPEGLMATLATNSVGPLLVAKHFSPLLMKGHGMIGLQASNEADQHKAVMVNMSAKVGSITDNALGGWYSYRMSKSALNMATKNLSIELGRGRNKVICVAMHPGTVNTDLSRPYHKNVPKDKLFSTELSVGYLTRIIDGLSPSDTGKYYSWDGSQLPF